MSVRMRLLFCRTNQIFTLWGGDLNTLVGDVRPFVRATLAEGEQSFALAPHFRAQFVIG